MAETRKQRENRIARDSRARQDANNTRRIEAEAMAVRAKAEADAAQARAAAETARIQAEAEASRQRAAAESARLKVDEDRRKAAEAREPAERLQQLGINIAAPALGYAAGVGLAKQLGKKHAAGVEAANKQLAELAKQVSRAMPKGGKLSPANAAKLAAIVKTSDVLRLAARPAALGLATAGVILAEGAFARFVLAPKAGDNKLAAEAIGAVGTASIFAATTMIGKRLIANATTTALPDSKAVAAIETARKLLPTTAPAAAAPKVSTASRVAKAAAAVPKSKAAAVALAIGGAAALAASMSGKAEAKGTGAAPAAAGGTLAKAADVGLTTATTIQAARLAANPGLRAAAGILSKVALPITAAVAVAGAVQGYRKTGTLGGTLQGAADGVTGGGYTALRDMIAASLKTAPKAIAASGEGSVNLMRSAASRTGAAMAMPGTMAPPAAAVPKTDGRTDGYTRQQNGRSVFVKGYQTPAR